jgi:hypothetical protein
MISSCIDGGRVESTSGSTPSSTFTSNSDDDEEWLAGFMTIANSCWRPAVPLSSGDLETSPITIQSPRSSPLPARIPPSFTWLSAYCFSRFSSSFSAVRFTLACCCSRRLRRSCTVFLFSAGVLPSNTNTGHTFKYSNLHILLKKPIRCAFGSGSPRSSRIALMNRKIHTEASIASFFPRKACTSIRRPHGSNRVHRPLTPILAFHPGLRQRRVRHSRSSGRPWGSESSFLGSGMIYYCMSHFQWLHSRNFVYKASSETKTLRREHVATTTGPLGRSPLGTSARHPRRPFPVLQSATSLWLWHRPMSGAGLWARRRQTLLT